MARNQECAVATQGQEIQLEGENQVHIEQPNGASVVLPFDQVKNLLSEKPLRRPNRSRPIEPS